NNQKRILIISIFFFLLLVASIIFVGYESYHNFELESRAKAEDSLSASANTKVNGLADWRNDLLNYTNIIYKNQTFSDSFKLYMQDTQNVEAQEHLRNWLEAYQEYDEFDRIYLLDTQGTKILSVPETIPSPDSEIVERIPEALRSGQITFIDFYRNEQDQRVYLAILAPIIDEQHSQRVIGFLTLRVDPDVRLFPTLSTKDADSATTESFIVRREGNEAVFLNALRFKPDAALNLRTSLENKDTLEVKAVLGQTGIVEGMDFRSVAMIGFIQAVPDSPWLLVTQMNTSEIYNPIRVYFGRTILVTGTIIFYSGLGLVLIWRQRQLKFYQSEAEAAEILRATEDALRLLTQELDNKVRERTEELQEVNQNLLDEKKRAELLVEDIKENREQLRVLGQQMVDMQEKQIKNLARELHDNIGQNLTTININLSLLQQQLPENYPQNIRSRLADTSQIVEETVVRMRNVMADFLPPMLESYGLAPTLSWYGEQFTKRTNIPVNVKDYRLSTMRLPPLAEVGFFRIVQEALNNVTKYAHAALVDIELRDDGNDMLMTIADNGVGFDPQLVLGKAGHWGFAIMRERAEALDASFEIQSAPDQGTKVLLRLAR
ncbi:MAG TPA: histidine kinase, partial [Anaerolineales bacterium]|nr:histidine kinase [Anaerolineales bacterium]